MRLDALRASYHKTAWGVLPEVFREITAFLSGRFSSAEIEARVEATRAQAREATVQSQAAVIPLQGLITPRGSFLSMLFGGGGGGLQGFRSDLREALGDDSVSSIVLDVDSPGGLVDLVPETAAEVRAARSLKPITAVANVRAASAAYWIASQAEELVVTQSGEVGSIGVLLFHEDVSKLEEEIGIKTTIISAGKYKAEGNPYEPLSREAKASLQSFVDDIYAMFVGDVAEGREAQPASVRSGFGQGRLELAADAVALGMADRVESFEATMLRLGAEEAAEPETEPAPEPEREEQPETSTQDQQHSVAEMLLP
jgi:signal peptide peptidase SppA